MLRRIVKILKKIENAPFNSKRDFSVPFDRQRNDYRGYYAGKLNNIECKNLDSEKSPIPPRTKMLFQKLSVLSLTQSPICFRRKNSVYKFFMTQLF